MEYKTVLKSYDIDSLLKESNMTVVPQQKTFEADDWNVSLNSYAKQGWTVKETRTVASEKGLLFWALLERPEKVQGF